MFKNINLNILLLFIAVTILEDVLVVFLMPSMMVDMMRQKGASQEAISNVYNSLSSIGEIFIIIVFSYSFFLWRKFTQFFEEENRHGHRKPSTKDTCQKP